MKKLFDVIWPLIIILIFSCSVSLAEEYNIGNTGEVRDNPYGLNDTIPSSYEGLEYYDVFLPYQKTVGEIGGYNTSVLHEGSASYDPMPDYRKASHVGDVINQQRDYPSLAACAAGTIPAGSFPCSYESDTGANILTDADGNKYYGSAIQYFFYWNETKFAKWDLSNRGDLFDIILTDGTVIHFVVGDTNAKVHTNRKPGTTSESAEGNTSTLNYPQYEFMCSSIAGNCIELWGASGSCNKFSQKYGISTSGTGNHIAFYRMYNGNIQKNPKRTSKAGSEAAYALDGRIITTDIGEGAAGENVVQGDNSGGGIVAEKDLEGLDGLLVKMNDNAQSVTLPNGDDLSVGEKVNLTTISGNNAVMLKEKVIQTIRTIVMAVGLILILYVILLWAAYMFDKVNNFFEVKILKLLTFGALDTYKDDLPGEKSIFKRLVMLSIVLFLTGVFIISGSIYVVIQRIFMFIRSLG